MSTRNLIRTCAVGLTCAGVGAGAGILGSASAATSSTTPNAAHPARAGLVRRAALRRAVHAEIVVPTAGGGFATVTYDRGSVESVAGTQLTVREGTTSATYRSVTLTIPSSAIVRLDRVTAQLSQLQAGDRVRVFAGPKHTLVSASDTPAPSGNATG
jgi:hypothetical protein